ncbi:acyl carrier protein [Pseudomonas sp. NPDC089406]|uniref:acyl carrier protein n=1 Tax=Pseudomonas sp. NPDC089406 TaxID=3364463 RepID=UPI00384B66D4
MRSHHYTDAYLLWIVSSFLEQSPAMVRSDLSMDELGADSFDMVELQALVEEAFGIQIPRQLPTYITFDELLTLVLRSGAALRC